MTLYKHYEVTEEDLLYRGRSSLERRLGKYVSHKIPQLVGFDSSKVKLIEPSEEKLFLLYCDSKLTSPRQEGKKKWLFGKKELDTPAVYDVEFVVKAESEERIKKFEDKELLHVGINHIESNKVSQAAFGFVVKDVEHLMYEFEHGEDIDYLADCRMSLSVDLPEEDGGEGIVLGNIEPVLGLRDYMLHKFPLEMHSIAFK